MKFRRKIGRQLAAARQELPGHVPSRRPRWAIAEVGAGAEERDDAALEQEIDQIGVVLLQIRVDWTAAHLAKGPRSLKANNC